MPAIVHLNLDDAWPDDPLGLRSIDAREWGPHLRFSAPVSAVERFYRELQPQISPFIVYGSGDFHHLTALWLRALRGPTVVVSFDNHPDWDVRPPKWCCGSWVNRALDLSHIEHVSVWGCGNFECWWPGQLFGNRGAERSGKLAVHPWADDRPPRDRGRRGAIVRSDWRQRFTEFCSAPARTDVYVTIDIDCLQADAAATDWENGRFTVEDIEWALREVRAHKRLVAGDICGALSPRKYARRRQRFASEMDHPQLARPPLAEAQRINLASLARLLPALAD